MELPALRRKLAALRRDVEQAQARVVATIDAKHSEFVEAASPIEDLREDFAALQNDLCEMAGLLGAEPRPEADSTNVKSPVVSLHAAVAEHKRLKEDLTALDAATKVLTVMLSVQSQFRDLDGLIAAARYEDAAEMIMEVARLLKGISAPDTSAEPAMVRAAKMQYYQRRAVLTTRLEDVLGQLLTFGDRCATARRLVAGGRGDTELTLRRVWDALQILDLRQRRVEQLAEQALRSVVRPLLEAGKRLPPARRLEARIVDSSEGGQQSCTWTWVSVPCQENGTENNAAVGNAPLSGGARIGVASEKQSSKPSVTAIVPVLESLFGFAHEYWGAGVVEVCGLVGQRLYTPVAQALLRHFDTGLDDCGASLERFELGIFQKGLASSRDKSLSRHVHEQRHALGKQRRADTLAEARTWLMQDEMCLVPVSDATEPGSVTQLMGRHGEAHRPQGNQGGGVTFAAQATGSGIGERLRRALADDGSLLRLPEMQVSEAAHKIARRVRELMEEAVGVAEQGRMDAARDLGRLARELVTLFSVLRPFAQKVQLRTSPRCGAIFLADCLYLAHVLILLPYSYKKRLPADLQQISLFVDLVPQLRRIGEKHFLVMLQHQQDQLATALQPFNLEAGVARDRSFVAAEAALGAAMQQVKLAASGLSAALPAQLLREVTGMLLGTVCRNLLGKLFKLHGGGASSEASCLSTLLNQAVNLGSGVMAVVGLEPADPEVVEDMPGWAALRVVADLLGSDFSRFLERRTVLTKALTRDEAVKLMQLSWDDEAFTAEDAWDVLRRADAD